MNKIIFAILALLVISSMGFRMRTKQDESKDLGKEANDLAVRCTCALKDTDEQGIMNCVVDGLHLA